MYRRPRFLEVLLAVRREMARDADYDVDLFAELVRSGEWKKAPEKPAAEGELSEPTGAASVPACDAAKAALRAR